MSKKPKTGTETTEWPFLKGNRPYFRIAAVCLVLYALTLGYGFSPMDEQWVILKNKEAMSSFSHIPGLFTSATLDMYYRPVWTSSFVLDMLAGQGSPLPFHLTNVLIHLACSLLVFRFFSLLGLSRFAAFTSALVFVVHPVNIHAVAWIPGRNDSLLALFTLLSCISLILYVKNRSRLRLGAHLLFFLLALLTKENAVVLPFIFATILFTLHEKQQLKKFLPLGLAWLLLATGWFVLRMNIIDYLPPVSAAATGEGITGFLSALVLHTGKTLLPVGQSVMPVMSDSLSWPFLIVTILAGAAAFRFGVYNRKLCLLGLCWFYALILIPAWFGTTSANGEHYEHRVYTSLIGVLLFITQIRIPAPKIIVQRLAFALVLVFAVKTFSRLPVYKNEISFAVAGAEESPSVSFFHSMLGNHFQQEGLHEKALPYLNEAIRLNPQRPELYNNRSYAYFMLRDYHRAEEDASRTLELKKDQPQTYVTRSISRYYLKNYTGAKNDLEEARRLNAAIDPAFERALNKALLQGKN
ncbi:MAG: TPR repeat-containing protein [Bacteroidetes bacterium]|nr:MAG: TPR repeat-containing protein [Bacteroidota bacterium]